MLPGEQVLTTKGRPAAVMAQTGRQGDRQLGRTHYGSRSLLSGDEGVRPHGSSNLGTPKRKSRSKARKSRRHGSGEGEADENAMPAPRPISKR